MPLSASLAVDGDHTTRWASQLGTDEEWLQLVLPDGVAICAVHVLWERAFATSYRVELSIGEGHPWHTVAEPTKAEEGSWDKLKMPVPVHASRLRLSLLSRGSEYGYSVYEIEVSSSEASPHPISHHFTRNSVPAPSCPRYMASWT